MELKKPVQICLPKLAGVVDEKAKHGRPRLDDPELSTYVIYIYMPWCKIGMPKFIEVRFPKLRLAAHSVYPFPQPLTIPPTTMIVA